MFTGCSQGELHYIKGTVQVIGWGFHMSFEQCHMVYCEPQCFHISHVVFLL